MSADRDSSILRLFGSQHKAQGCRRVGIQHLPVEVLHTILIFSHSSAFPVVCRHFRQACQNAGPAVKAKYIFERYLDRLAASVAGNPCRRRHKHRTCKNLASRIAAVEHQSAPSPLELPDCVVDLIRENYLDLVTFAAELGICTVNILERVVNVAAAALPRSLADCVLPPITQFRVEALDDASKSTRTGSSTSVVPQLPKRLFRRIDRFDYSARALPATAETTAQGKPSLTPDQTRPKKRRKRHIGAIAEEKTILKEIPPDEAQVEAGRNDDLPWPAKLLFSLASLPRHSKVDSDLTVKRKHEESRCESTDDLQKRIGPVTSREELELMLALLLRYSADASSHQGYPLAMAVHRRAYALVHLLLYFAADPTCKDGLAAQIAIRNGSLDILHLLVQGPRLEHDVTKWLPLDAPFPRRFGSKPFRLDQTHLRLAIQCRQWDLVDYIWHEQKVSPDIACLRLIDKLKK